jgi:hypothetical protein
VSPAEHPGQDGIHSSVLDAETIRSSSLYNEDLAPIPASRRSWGTYNYAALWIAMSVNIPTYLLASGMIAGGMNWKQAIFTVSWETCWSSSRCCSMRMPAQSTGFPSLFLRAHRLE